MTVSPPLDLRFARILARAVAYVRWIFAFKTSDSVKAGGYRDECQHGGCGGETHDYGEVGVIELPEANRGRGEK